MMMLSEFEIFSSKHISILGLILVLLLSGCYQDESLNEPVKGGPDIPETALDTYIRENFTEEYGMAIRYKFVDNFVEPNQRVAPPKVEVVRPMLDFIDKFWIGPYLEVSNGEDFFREHVPAEIVFLGGPIYNNDGTITLGTADAGAQITFTDVNQIDETDEQWRTRQFNVVYHEFAHIVHQRYKLPPAFETISPSGYTGAGSWFVLTNDDALQRGCVTPYATSSPNEDFAETVAFFIFDTDFDENFMIDEENCASAECEARNVGREMIRQKLAAISDHYAKVTGVKLESLRESVQAKL